MNGPAQNDRYRTEKPPVLDRRLSTVASLVTPGCVPADIGTDHAYLPCHLILTGRVSRAVASDVAPGPLENARRTVERLGLTDAVRCVLSDGTKRIPPDAYDTLICAGMGGELIRDILRDTASLETKRLVLQPMTHSEDLRRFLCERGFSVVSETAVLDGRRCYIAFSAGFTARYEQADDAFYHYFGGYPARGDEASALFTEKQAERLRKRLAGLLHTPETGAEEIRMIQKILNDERLVRSHGNSERSL